MMLRRLAVLVLTLGAAGMASPATAQTFEEALSAAYRNNPTLQAARARLRGVDEGVPQALSDWRPSVTVFGDAGIERVDSDPGGSARGTEETREPRSVSLDIRQSLYRGGRTVAATRAAFNRVQAERARLLSTEQGVLLAAVTAYMDVFRDQAILELNINNEQVLRRQLEATEDRFRVGEVTRTDVSQAQARLAGATADRIQAEADLEASRAGYQNIIGEPAGTPILPDPPADLPENVDAANQAASQFNPGVVAAQFDERAARDDAREVKGELLPSLDLEGTASHSLDSSGDDSEFTRYRGLVALTVPLYQQGAVYSRLREARQNIVESRELIDSERRAAVENSTSAWEQLLAARAQIEALGAQVTANEVALEGVQREAEVGSRTVLDVLDAEQELLDSRVDLVTAERDLIVAIFDVKSAIGQLTARLLDLPVELYDPEAHYDEVRGKWFGARSSGDSE